MNKISTLLLFLFLTSLAYSQDLRTIGQSSDTSKTFKIGGYGEPIIGASQLNGDWAIMLGLKGGVTLNRFFSIGPVAKVYSGIWEFKGNNLNFNDSADLKITMGSVGLFLEYTHKMESPIHLSVPVNIMIGGAQINEIDYFEDGKDRSQEVENSGFIVIEPEINVDFNIAKFFIPNFKIGYRGVIGSHLVNASDANLSGMYFGLGLKFGKF